MGLSGVAKPNGSTLASFQSADEAGPAPRGNQQGIELEFFPLLGFRVRTEAHSDCGNQDHRLTTHAAQISR